MQSKIKEAEISAEIKLSYVEQGNNSGVPVIFLHGVTDSYHSFDLLFPHLPETVRAFAVTQRGHGDSSRPQTYSTDEFAADIAGFMDHLGLESAVIVGHSMGSFNAQRVAIRYPERVSGLVLIGSFSTCRDNQGVIEFVENEIAKLSDPIPAEFAREFQESTLAKSIPADFLNLVVRESLKTPARVWQAACESMIVNDNTDKLKLIKAKTLLLWGELDAYFSLEDQQRLLKHIPEAELKVYREVGHTPQWEIPGETAADILNFIENLKFKKTAASTQIA